MASRTPKDLISDVATSVSSGGSLALLISVAVGASRSPVIWGCGVALVVLFFCLLFWRYDIVGGDPRWRRVSLFSVMVVAAVAIPVVGVLQMTVLRPRFHPQTAAVKDCRPAGPLRSQKVQYLPPGVSAGYILSRDVYKCSSEGSEPGDIPVYLAPGSETVVGELLGTDYPWFVCRLSGPDAPAWYYTQGDFPGQPGTAHMHAWGVVASSLKPASPVPVCPAQIRQIIATGSS